MGPEVKTAEPLKGGGSLQPPGNFHHPVIQEQYPWLAPAVDRLQIPPRWLPEILPLITEAPRRVSTMCIAKMIGIPWYAMAEFISFAGDPESSSVLPLLEAPLHSKVLQLRPEAEGQVLEGFPSASEHSNLFSADFRCVPYLLARTLMGAHKSAQYFAAFLPDPHQSVASQIAKGMAGKHVYGAFCYLRFYEEDDTILITEIQSDEWRKINDRFLRQEVYYDWPVVLLSSFEAFLSSCFPERRLTLAIADSEYIKERWRLWDRPDPDPFEETFEGIADSVASFFYEKLPAQLLYVRSDDPLQTRENNLRDKNLVIQRPWKKVLEPGQGAAPGAIAPFAALVSAEVDRMGDEYRAMESAFADQPGPELIDPSRGYKIILRVNGHTPRTDEEQERAFFQALNDFPYKPGGSCPSDLNHLEQEGAALMGESREMLPHEVYPVCPELTDIQAQEIARSPEATILSGNEFLSRTECPVFRIPPIGISAAGNGLITGALGGDGVAFSIVTSPQEIEPALVGLMPTEQGFVPFSMNFFGGGALPLEKLASSRMKDILEYSPALVASETQHAGRFVLHGVSKEAVIERFVSLLGFCKLSSGASYILDGTLPVPYCASNFVGLPVVKSESNLNLRFSPVQNPLGQLRTLSTTNIRLSTFLTQLLIFGYYSRMVPGEIVKELIDGMLEFLYALNGEQLVKPDATPALPDNTVSIGSTFRYLQRVYEANSEAADRIFHRISVPTLGFTGIVHRMGGFLSAAPLSSIDRKKGPKEIDFRNDLFFNWASPSEFSLNSIDITGTIHNTTFASHQPWINLTRRGTDIPEEEQQEYRRIDLEEWNNAMFWFRAVLRGMNMKNGEKVVDYPFGRPGTQESLQRLSQGQPLMPGKPLIRLVGRNVEFTVPEHAGLYSSLMAIKPADAPSS